MKEKLLLVHLPDVSTVHNLPLLIEQISPHLFCQNTLDRTLVWVELRETQLGTKDGECVLMGLLVTMVLEETPRAKQVDEVIESTILEMKYLEDIVVTIS